MKKEATKEEATNEENPICGIIMPISSIDNCSMEHWTEVKDIISEAICNAGYTPNLVSNADDIGIIQKRIIQNIYDNDIVVVDVSGKNPNVMFELGMRLAFDKPAIIVIDDQTDYSFDTSPIEHLSYPRDLRYYNIIKFKEQLKNKIIATAQKAENDPNYTTFLKNFGEFEVAHVEKKEGSVNDVLLSKIEELGNNLSRLERCVIPREYIMPNPFGNERIKTFIRSSIDKFCKVNNVQYQTLKEYPNIFTDKLFAYLRENVVLRKYCQSAETLRYYMELVLSDL